MNYEGQCSLFDVTVFDGHVKYNHHLEVVAALTPIAKHFVFQKERCDKTQRIHWQVRLSLHKKKRASECIKYVIPQFPGHWTVTTLAVHDNPNQFNYVMKADTRIEGPWSEKDVPAERPPETRMVKAMMSHFEANSLYPYQQYCFDQSTEYNHRWIDLFLDQTGHLGKSAFCEWLEYMGKAVEVPPLRDMQDLVGFVMDMPESTCYMIDMPRGMKKDKLAEFYAGIETMKNGYLYDKRYHGRKKRIERPRIFIFTNTVPVLDLLSADRWRIWHLQDKESPLTEWSPPSIDDQFCADVCPEA